MGPSPPCSATEPTPCKGYDRGPSKPRRHSILSPTVRMSSLHMGRNKASVCCKNIRETIRETIGSCVSANYECDHLARQVAETRTRSAKQQLEPQLQYHTLLRGSSEARIAGRTRPQGSGRVFTLDDSGSPMVRVKITSPGNTAGFYNNGMFVPMPVCYMCFAMLKSAVARKVSSGVKRRCAFFAFI